MKSLQLSWRIVPFCAIVSAAVLSCKKNDNPVMPAQQSSVQMALMNATNDVVQASALESQDVEDIIGSADSSSCPVITFDTSRNVYPHTKTIDFGSGCTSQDSLTRKGIKIITYYADADTASIGTLISDLTYRDFSVNGINVVGDVKTYIDSSSTKTMKILKIVSSKTLTSTGGDTKTFTGTNYWKQIKGWNTSTRQDDVFQITGNAAGTETLDGATQVEWSSSISSTNPVIKRVDCDHRTMGTVDIALHITTGGSTIFTEVLDYGNGDCDNVATLSINGGTPQQVTLPLYFWPLSL